MIEIKMSDLGKTEIGLVNSEGKVFAKGYVADVRLDQDKQPTEIEPGKWGDIIIRVRVMEKDVSLSNPLQH